MEVQDCVQGSGKMCGAILIDEAFESMLRSTLGDKWTRMSRASRKTIINQDWEHGLKKQYDDTERPWDITVPTDAFRSSIFSLHPFDDNKGQVPLKRGSNYNGTVVDLSGALHQS